MINYQLKENEVAVPLQAFGIQYVCPYCKKGYMIANERKTMNQKIALIPGRPPMIIHDCENCKKELQLPVAYPKIEWMEMQAVEPDNTNQENKSEGE